MIILLFIVNTFFKKQIQCNTHLIQHFKIINLTGGKKKKGGDLNKTFEIFPDKQQFFNQGENIYILDKPNEITNYLIKLFSKHKLNWSYEYSGEAIKYYPTYIFTNTDINQEEINKLLNYMFINQIYIINPINKKFDYNSKLHIIEINSKTDIIYNQYSPIFQTPLNNLDALFNTLSFIYLGKSISKFYYPEIFDRMFLVKYKYLNVGTTITAFNHGLTNWCQQKNRTIKLSDLNFMGQGFANICVTIPNYKHLLRVGLRLSSHLEFGSLNDEKISFLKKFGVDPFVNFYDYNFNPTCYRWMEVDKCKPIKSFENFKDFTNYDKHKLKHLLLRAKKLFNNPYSDRKINNNYIDYYSWYDLNMGNIMINDKNEYVIVDMDISFGKNWKNIQTNLSTSNFVDQNLTAYDFIGTKPLADTETYTLLYYVLKEHKYEYINNKIIEYFLIKLNYLRFLENQKLDMLISKTTDTEKQIELKNKFNTITKKIVDNLIHENFNFLPDDI